MSVDLAIRAQGLGKRYHLGEESDIFTLTDYLGSLFSSKAKRKQREEFWALRNVSFDLPKGSITGVIGKNGAGKSTLLKILSRITPPTEGAFSYNGTMASLLEVGSGFKQELTGRDNIFLSGTILGLRRRQIQDKLEEIVEFAEIGRFIDTPVKRYSSGMYVRLAFAVAAHLEPDILLLDEVLAVGDIKFQKKCLQQMGAVSREGRTIVFVSHNMQAMGQLCRHGLLLEAGAVVASDEMGKVISLYQQRCRDIQKESGVFEYHKPIAQAGIERIVIHRQGTPRVIFDLMDRVEFTVFFQVKEDLDDLKVILHFNTLEGQSLFGSTHLDWQNFQNGTKERIAPFKKGRYRVEGSLPSPLLNAGFYDLSFYLSATHVKVFDGVKGIELEITDDHMSFASCVDMSPSSCPVTPPVAWKEIERLD